MFQRLMQKASRSSSHSPARNTISENAVNEPEDEEHRGSKIIVGKEGDNAEQDAEQCTDPGFPENRADVDPTIQEMLTVERLMETGRLDRIR